MTLMIKWWKMTFFGSVPVIWDNFCFDASIEKFHSSSQEGGGVSSSLHGGSVDVITLPDESVDDTDEKVLENKVFVECGVI